MISNLQIRAARALLGWSQQRLADEAGLSAITVKRLEASDETLAGQVRDGDEDQRARSRRPASSSAARTG